MSVTVMPLWEKPWMVRLLIGHRRASRFVG